MEIDTCETKLTLYFSARNLIDADFFSKSDPFAVIYLSTPSPSLTHSPALPTPSSTAPQKSTPRALARTLPPTIRKSSTRLPDPGLWEEVGRTETIKDCLSPEWVTSVTISYFFERSQRLKVHVYDRDAPTDNLAPHDFLGEANCTVPQIVRSPGNPPRIVLRLTNDEFPGKKCGSLTIIAEEVAELRRGVVLNMACKDVKTGLMSSTRPWLSIERKMGNEWKRLWVSEKGKPTGAGRKKGEWAWSRVEINMEQLCRGDTHLPLRFHVGKTSKGGREKSIGMVETSLYKLGEQKTVSLRNGLKTVGSLVCNELSITEHSSFLDYIMGGLSMSLIIGIDFTASNGSPTEPNTLHFMDQYVPNEYELAIRAVGDILAQYDKDQRFPAFGFGAKLPPHHRVAQHCFSLTGNSNPVCTNIDGVLEAYRQTLYNVKLSGPTIFSEIIRAAAEYAVKAPVTQEEQLYTVLLMLTDGVINDMEATKTEIITASSLPLSIVIIGVGHADFTDMNELDGDLNPLGVRDIVQFVPFSTYKGAPEVLAAKVLEEIPGQVVSFMEGRGIRPGQASKLSTMTAGTL